MSNIFYLYHCWGDHRSSNLRSMSFRWVDSTVFEFELVEDVLASNLPESSKLESLDFF